MESLLPIGAPLLLVAYFFLATRSMTALIALNTLIAGGILYALYEFDPNFYSSFPGAPTMFGLALAGMTLVTLMFRPIIKGNEEHKRKQYEGELRRIESARKKREQHEANQGALKDELDNIAKWADECFHRLPGWLKDVEKALDQAEFEFRDGAYAPFWDAIELAVNSFAKFEADIQRIRNYSDAHNHKKEALESAAPEFDVDLRAFPDVVPVLTRMKAIIRPAQKDIHFAQIFEARKTNKLLVKGFSSLGQALNEMSSQIASSIDALSSSLLETAGELTESNRSSAQTIVESIKSIDTQLASDSSERRLHESKEMKELSKINLNKR